MDNNADKLSLKIYPDHVLREICAPVEKFDSQLKDIISEMTIIMRANRGIGLAAPQVGILKRLFICEIASNSIGIINPVIKNSKGQSEMIESCLSLPKVQVNISRNKKFFLQGYNSCGQKIKMKFGVIDDTFLEDVWKLEVASYPEDEAASKEQLRYRMKHAKALFCGLLDEKKQTIIGFVCATKTVNGKEIQKPL